MAEQQTHDAVDQKQSVGAQSPSDVPATTNRHSFSQGEGDAKFGVEGGEPRSNEQSQAQEDSSEAALTEGVVNDVQFDVDIDDGRSTPEILSGSRTPQDDALSKDGHALEDSTTRSDTDGSRADDSVTGDTKMQDSSKTTKKFTPKPVSFAKYSVPKATTASTIAKAAVDKPTTLNSLTASLLQTGRPRLVAKSTTSLQQKTKAFRPSAPDPMQVWNKNRITPTPSTKHLTDEELKQQYGIHMTSRLQEDGESKEAKWADIDDDEEDWAPTTIEWNDGTKSTVTPATVPQVIEQKAKLDVQPAEIPRPLQPLKTLTAHLPSSIGPNAKVLKLGQSAEKQQAQKLPSQQSKGPSEKTPLNTTQTAAAPPPSKSPWAQLPPVDKVSPIAVNPQPQLAPLQKYPTGFSYAQSPAQMAPSPAQEISADDFSRAWRDAPAAQSRELYMPNSGKYEAVPETKRRMSRNDQHFRAPALLQRPSQTDRNAPAEPSAAFQTTRTSTDQARRRASSNISGGSGQFARRLSVVQSGDLGLAIVDDMVTEDTARPDFREGTEALLQTVSFQAQATPNSATEQSLYDQQQRLMKERSAQARQRRQEEEARQEAEKQERIRQKLALLPPLPDRVQKEQKAQEEVADAPLVPASPSPPVATSHPKPPLPSATGEPQQYGMMKVHPLDSVKKHNFAPPHQPDVVTGAIPASPPQTKEFSQDMSNVTTPVINGVRPSSDSQRPTLTDASSLSDRSPHPPKAVSVGSDARAGWGPDPRTSQPGNLWSLPSNRALGNGAFDQSLSKFTPQDLSSRNGGYPAQGWTNNKTPIERSPQPPFATPQLSEHRQQVLPSQRSPEQVSLAANSEIDSLLPASKPVPIGPPQSQNQSHGWQPSPILSQVNGVAAWNNFQQVASQQERAESERFHREAASRREEEMRTGVRQGPQYNFNETWKQVQLGEQAAQRHVGNINQSSVPAANMFGAVGSAPSPEPGPKPANGPPARGSRFFPQTADPVAGQNRRAVTYSHPSIPRTPSPPPAEEYASLHPAFDGDLQRPVVHFPREKAVVKLPPAVTEPPTARAPVAPTVAEPTQPLTWAARVSQAPPQPTLRAVSTPIASTPSWQERFNGLLRKGSPPKSVLPPVPAALAVTSSTKEPLDIQLNMQLTAVSLPLQQEYEPLQDTINFSDKSVEDEEDLFEDREAGSLPIINIPRDLPTYNCSRMAAAYMRAPQHRSPPVEPTSVPGIMIQNWIERVWPADKELFALIKVPGMDRSKKIVLRSGRAGSLSDAGVLAKGSPVTFGNKYPKHKGPKPRHVSENSVHNARSRSSQGPQSHTPSQDLQSAASTQSASPVPAMGSRMTSNGTCGAVQNAAIPESAAAQSNGQLKGSRRTSHGPQRGWKGKSHHQPPQPQPQAAH